MVIVCTHPPPTPPFTNTHTERRSTDDRVTHFATFNAPINTSQPTSTCFRKRITSAVILGPSSELGRLISAKVLSDKKFLNIDLSFLTWTKVWFQTHSLGALWSGGSETVDDGGAPDVYWRDPDCWGRSWRCSANVRRPSSSSSSSLSLWTTVLRLTPAGGRFYCI